MGRNSTWRDISGWLRPRLARAWLAMVVIATASCSSMQPVDLPSAMRGVPPAHVEFGSLVEVRMLDGRKDTFRVTEMNDGGLGGNAGFYWYDEMKNLKVEQPGVGDEHATAIVLGVLGVAALVWLVGNADSVSVCSLPPCPFPEP